MGNHLISFRDCWLLAQLFLWAPLTGAGTICRILHISLELYMHYDCHRLGQGPCIHIIDPLSAFVICRALYTLDKHGTPKGFSLPWIPSFWCMIYGSGFLCEHLSWHGEQAKELGSDQQTLGGVNLVESPFLNSPPPKHQPILWETSLVYPPVAGSSATNGWKHEPRMNWRNQIMVQPTYLYINIKKYNINYVHVSAV